MGRRTTAARGTRHLLGAAVQSFLLAAIVGAVTLTLSAVNRPAGAITGLGVADAAGVGRATLTIPPGTIGGTTTASATPLGDDIWVRVSCFQAGSQVLEAYRRTDAQGQATFVLGPTADWSSGAATCIGEQGSWLRGTHWQVVARTAFDVAG